MWCLRAGSGGALYTAEEDSLGLWPTGACQQNRGKVSTYWLYKIFISWDNIEIFNSNVVLYMSVFVYLFFYLLVWFICTCVCT
jgi:hypothetical protein